MQVTWVSAGEIGAVASRVGRIPAAGGGAGAAGSGAWEAKSGGTDVSGARGLTWGENGLFPPVRLCPAIGNNHRSPV